MGHLRLADRLPRYQNWQRVVEALQDPSQDLEEVAAKTADAAKYKLSETADSPYVWYPYWFLIQLADHAQSPARFRSFLRQHDIEVDEDQSTVSLFAELTRSIEDRRQEFPSPTALDELALDAFQEAAGQIVLSGTESLFDSGLEDARQAFARVAPARPFGRLSRAYLGAYYGEILSYFLSYELGNEVGPEHRFESLDDAEKFSRQLDRYTHHVSELVEEFAEEWYGKEYWKEGHISQDAARRFLHVAFRKFRQQLELETQ
jgi:hypothetical protein